MDVLWGLRTPSVAYFELMPTQTLFFFYHDAAPNSSFRGVDAEAEEGT